HIGYEVLEPFRGNGFAYQACMAIAPLVRLLYPEVIITCDPDNFGSMRTIEKLGATFLDEVPVGPEEAGYPRKPGKKRRYSWRPGDPQKPTRGGSDRSFSFRSEPPHAGCYAAGICFDNRAQRLWHLPKAKHFARKHMKKFNVGIVGYGWVATAHIPAIN